MIATLSGQLLLKYLDRAVVEVGGVGYEVFLSTDSLSRLGDLDSNIFLFIHTNVREDAIVLYGFIEEEEKEMFLILKTVSGIGPKLALSILSGMRVDELCRAIGSEEIKLLTTLQGVGKKTAERLCVDLKDKVGHLMSDLVQAGADAGQLNQSAGAVVMDVLSALVNLGYPDPVARQALSTVKKQVGDAVFAEMEIEEMLKQGLRALA
jgi:Holliday junction DNA helicase RuvA